MNIILVIAGAVVADFVFYLYFGDSAVFGRLLGWRE